MPQTSDNPAKRVVYKYCATLATSIECIQNGSQRFLFIGSDLAVINLNSFDNNIITYPSPKSV